MGCIQACMSGLLGSIRVENMFEHGFGGSLDFLLKCSLCARLNAVSKYNDPPRFYDNKSDFAYFGTMQKNERQKTFLRSPDFQKGELEKRYSKI